MVIVPPRFLDEIKAQPESILSFQKQVSERFLGKYTGLGVNDTLVRSVKVDLTKNIIQILGELSEEVDYSVGLNIGDCPGKSLYNQLLDIRNDTSQNGSQSSCTILYLPLWHYFLAGSLLDFRLVVIRSG